MMSKCPEGYLASEFYISPYGINSCLDVAYTVDHFEVGGGVTFTQSSTYSRGGTMVVNGSGWVKAVWKVNYAAVTVAAIDYGPGEYGPDYNNLVYSNMVTVDGVPIAVGGSALSTVPYQAYFQWTAGSTHTLSVVNPTANAGGFCALYNWSVDNCKYVFDHWEDSAGNVWTTPTIQVPAPPQARSYWPEFRQYYRVTFQVIPPGWGTLTVPIQKDMGYGIEPGAVTSAGQDSYWVRTMRYAQDMGGGHTVWTAEQVWLQITTAPASSAVFFQYWGGTVNYFVDMTIAIWVETPTVEIAHYTNPCPSSNYLTIMTNPASEGSTSPVPTTYNYTYSMYEHVCNGGVENNGASWDLTNYPPQTVSGLGIVTSPVHSGQYALKIRQECTSQDYPQCTGGEASVPVYGLDSTKRYRLSYWVYIASSTKQYPRDAGIVVDVGGNHASSYIAEMYQFTTIDYNVNDGSSMMDGGIRVPGAGWQPMSFDFGYGTSYPIPQDEVAYTDHIFFGGWSMGSLPYDVTVYIDDVSVVDVNAQAPDWATPTVKATPAAGYVLSGWNLDGVDVGIGNPITVQMDSDHVLIANFGPALGITVTSQPSATQRVAGFVKVDNLPITTPTVYPDWQPGSQHTLVANSPVSCGAGCQWVFLNWQSQSLGTRTDQTIPYTTPPAAETVVANYKQQYTLTMQVTSSSGGSTTPSFFALGACGYGCTWRDAGSVVQISAVPNTANGYIFTEWTGSGTGRYTGPMASSTVTMNAPIVEKATFTTQACPIG